MPNQRSNTKKIIFPEGSGLIIYDLVKKYGLKETQEKVVQEMVELKTAQEKEKVAENLPIRKIAKIIKRVAEGEIPLSLLISELKNQLNLSNEVAKNLAKELKEKLLIQKEEIEVEEKIPPSPKPKKPDIYREPIE